MANLYILINIERVSKYTVTILGQRVVTPAHSTTQSFLNFRAALHE